MWVPEFVVRLIAADRWHCLLRTLAIDVRRKTRTVHWSLGSAIMSRIAWPAGHHEWILSLSKSNPTKVGTRAKRPRLAFREQDASNLASNLRQWAPDILAPLDSDSALDTRLALEEYVVRLESMATPAPTTRQKQQKSKTLKSDQLELHEGVHPIFYAMFAASRIKNRSQLKQVVELGSKAYVPAHLHSHIQKWLSAEKFSGPALSRAQIHFDAVICRITCNTLSKEHGQPGRCVIAVWRCGLGLRWLDGWLAGRAGGRRSIG